MSSKRVEIIERIRHMANFSPEQPYNDLPLLPPHQSLETRSVLKACIGARTALAALQQSCRLIPNPAVLINTIPLLEAQASSEIENIVTTADALFRYAQSNEEEADPATKEALRYRSALYRGFQQLEQRPVCTGLAVEICRNFKGPDYGIRKIPGTALRNSTSGEIVYTPPVGEDIIRGLLANWEKFIHEQEDLDPLVRMAVAHYQFEAIHPFPDGNGRTGRILNLLQLIEQKLLDTPILYLSRHIIRNKAEYYRLLNAVTREGAWEEWILYMLAAVEETARWTTDKIAAIRSLQAHTQQYVRDRLPGVYTHELVDLIFVQPYCRIQNVVEAGLGHRQTASAHLKQLCEIGVLREIKMGREKLFIHPKFVGLLTQDGHDFPAYNTQGHRPTG